MEERIFTDVTKMERIQLLKDNCYAAETMSYTRRITDAELNAMRQEVAQMCQEIYAKEEEKKMLVKELADEIKQLKEQRRDLVDKVMHKTEWAKGECYKFVEDGKAWYYNEDGEMVMCRPANEQERQGMMFQNTKAAAM